MLSCWLSDICLHYNFEMTDSHFSCQGGEENLTVIISGEAGTESSCFVAVLALVTLRLREAGQLRG